MAFIAGLIDRHAKLLQPHLPTDPTDIFATREGRFAAALCESERDSIDHPQATLLEGRVEQWRIEGRAVSICEIDFPPLIVVAKQLLDRAMRP
jgi:hypothetical protein